MTLAPATRRKDNAKTMDDQVKVWQFDAKQALEALPVAVLMCDVRHQVEAINAAAQSLLGEAADTLVGNSWRNLFRTANGSFEKSNSPNRASARINGHSILAEARTVEGNDAILVTLALGSELSPADRDAAKRLDVTYSSGQVSSWEWDLDTDIIHDAGYWSGRLKPTEHRSHCTGKILLSHTHPDDVDVVMRNIRAHLRGETEFYEVEQRIRLSNGEFGCFLARGQAIEYNAEGRVKKLFGTFIDITERRKQETLLELALHTSRQGVWEWDALTDTIIEHKAWRPQLDDYEFSSPLSGKEFLALIHPADINNLQKQLEAHLKKELEMFEAEIRLRRKNGVWGDVLISGRALQRDNNGRVTRVIGTYTEISKAKTERRQRELALMHGRQGLWEWLPDEDEVNFSYEWYALMGREPGTVRSHLRDVQKVLHPSSVPSGRAAIVPVLKGESDEFEMEQKFRHADGHYIDVLSRGRAVERDENGVVNRIIGTHTDITELVQNRTGATNAKLFLETVINALPQRVFWKDTNSRYLGCSQSFANDIGLDTPADVVGLVDEDMPWHEIADQVREDDGEVLSGEAESNIKERFITAATGTSIWVETTKAAVKNERGEIIGVLGTYSDITERLAHEQQLKAVAEAFTDTESNRVLDAVTSAAAELSGADYAFVARLVDGNEQQLRITSNAPRDAGLTDITYDLAGTPCRDSLSADMCIIPSAVRARYPSDQLLVDLNVDAYAGKRLSDADGRQIGILVLLFYKPVSDDARTSNVLNVFAARAAAELERELNHAELRSNQLRVSAAIEGSAEGIWDWNPQTDALEILGENFAEGGLIRGETMFERIHPDDRIEQEKRLAAYFAGRNKHYEFEGRFRDRNGEYRWTLVRGKTAERNEAGEATRMLGTMSDISNLKQVQHEFKDSQRFLKQVVDTVPQGVFWQDRELRYVGCNEQFADLARVGSPEALIGLTDRELWWHHSAETFCAEDAALLNGSKGIQSSEIKLARPDQQEGCYELTKVPMRNAAGEIIGVLGAVHDITVRKQAETIAQRLARFDPLTDLPNRRYFSERLESALAVASRRQIKGALLFIDLDQFKQINDSLGHSVGDDLLKAVSERLVNVTRQEDTVARLGGDEFVVLLPEIASDFETCARQAQFVADKIHRSLGQAFQFDHHQLHITPTIGISLFPEAGKGVEEVLKEADTAMYSGKAAGRNVTRFFRQEMELAAQQRLRIEGDLRRAIEREELLLHYQPQVNRSGDVTGAEVLLRWQHPVHDMIPPGEFIPIAEERGLIVEIGHWVLEAAFSQLRQWLDNNVDIRELAINVSSRQFRSEDFVSDVERLLVKHKIPPHCVVFEITEHTVIEDVEATIEIMDRLRHLGIRFSIDDFGVGYSSLSYLKRLPIDQLKIDRSFIADIGRDHNDEIICQTIVAMSQQLRLETIAEGVETEEQYNFLSRLRCSGYQGYLFLPPVSAAAFTSYLESQQPMG